MAGKFQANGMGFVRHWSRPEPVERADYPLRSVRNARDGGLALFRGSSPLFCVAGLCPVPGSIRSGACDGVLRWPVPGARNSGQQHVRPRPFFLSSAEGKRVQEGPFHGPSGTTSGTAAWNGYAPEESSRYGAAWFR